MSTIRFFGIICFSVSLYAQFTGAQGVSITGELRSHGEVPSNQFVVEVYDMRTNEMIGRAPVSDGQFEIDHVPAGGYMVRVVTSGDDSPVVQEYHQFELGGEELILNLPERATDKPISGVVSVHELQHPVPKKALQDAYKAQQLDRDKQIPKAIEKLEDAVRIDPEYRDAHVNLGVLYARTGRNAEAKNEFQKAADLGPPDARVFVNLAMTCLSLQQYRDAETAAHKALALESGNVYAQKVLQFVSQH